MSDATKTLVGDVMRKLSGIHTSLVETEVVALKTKDHELAGRVASLREEVSKLHQEMLKKIGRQAG